MSTSRQYFGTDGVRGPYGGPLVNEQFFARLAQAAGKWSRGQPGSTKPARDATPPLATPPVLIGRDTRASGESLARAVMAGLSAAELNRVDLGVLPTPALAWELKRTGAALGVVITASHNPAADNGIKFFKCGGVKLSDEEEAQIEQLLMAEALPDVSGVTLKLPVETPVLIATQKGASDDSAARDRMLSFLSGLWLGAPCDTEYIAAMARLLPPAALQGWQLVLDTANGATVNTSLNTLRTLGAEVIGLGYRPDGLNINAGVGSEHPEKMAALVRTHGARLGIAHDGDGDRCVLCDELGEVLDGDEILTLLALHALRQGRLAADTLVVTVQSNLGVDAALATAGGRVVRTPVGDRHVAERMRAEGAMLGGESSGHIICADVSPTGDGLVAALRVMEVMRATGRPLSELRRALTKFPQASTTITAQSKPPLSELAALTAAILQLQTALGERGRVLVRWSGTEPKLRLLVEGPDEATVRAGLAALVAAVRADLGLSDAS